MDNKLKLYCNIDEVNKFTFGLNIEGSVEGTISSTLKLPFITEVGAFSVDGVFTSDGTVEFMIPRINHLFKPGIGEYIMTLRIGELVYEPFTGEIEYFDSLSSTEEEGEEGAEDIWESLAKTPEDKLEEEYKKLILEGLDIPIDRDLMMEDINKGTKKAHNKTFDELRARVLENAEES